jgi:hypothetical protein
LAGAAGGVEAVPVGGSAAGLVAAAGITADTSRSQATSLMAARTAGGTRWENIAIMGTTTMHATSRAERILMVAPALGAGRVATVGAGHNAETRGISGRRPP